VIHEKPGFAKNLAFFDHGLRHCVRDRRLKFLDKNWDVKKAECPVVCDIIEQIIRRHDDFNRTYY
jgi:hypothetical protein